MQVKTIHEIVRSLPNGFEDCRIRAFHLEAASRTAFLDIAVIVNRQWGSKSELRAGRLSATNVGLFFVEPPSGDSYLRGEGLSASGDLELDGLNDHIEQVLRGVPEGAETIRFFVHDWNSFLYVAADRFAFTWLEGE